jgi:hypothetical protein
LRYYSVVCLNGSLCDKFSLRSFFVTSAAESDGSKPLNSFLRRVSHHRRQVPRCSSKDSGHSHKIKHVGHSKRSNLCTSGPNTVLLFLFMAPATHRQLSGRSESHESSSHQFPVVASLVFESLHSIPSIVSTRRGATNGYDKRS